MMNHNTEITTNGVNGRCSQSTTASPGRSPVAHADSDQAGIGRHHNTGPSEEAANLRMKFSREDNITVMECYYTSDPSRRGYIKRMAEIWRENGRMALTDQRLADQARVIIRKKYLTDVELMDIERRVNNVADQSGSGEEEEEVRDRDAAASQPEVVIRSEEGRNEGNEAGLTVEQKELI